MKNKSISFYEKRNSFIRKNYKKISNAKLAKRFNVSRQRISQIALNKFPSPRLKDISKIKILTKEKREFLGLPTIKLY